MRRNVTGRSVKRFVYAAKRNRIGSVRYYGKTEWEKVEVDVEERLALAQRACSFLVVELELAARAKRLFSSVANHDSLSVTYATYSSHISYLYQQHSRRCLGSGRPHGSGPTSLAGRASQLRSCRRRLRLETE